MIGRSDLSTSFNIQSVDDPFISDVSADIISKFLPLGITSPLAVLLPVLLMVLLVILLSWVPKHLKLVNVHSFTAFQ